ncbi:MAG: hypothetical protein EOM80_05430 [Erysipelotrichia bacterium]|nr:hypothetical protein [Candidatus Riflebacteria bacterium]NCB38194.1 hypothetical protein [Erysipelotrichia bacterium]
MNIRFIFVVALVPYALSLMLDYQYHFIDGANLLIHEAGHLLFNFFGNKFLMVAGGTILQLALPMIFAAHLLLNKDRFGAGLCFFWGGESLMYTAVYLGDARAQRLPLWGGGSHDWAYMLGKIGLINYCQEIASFLHFVAVIILFAGLYFAGKSSLDNHSV